MSECTLECAAICTGLCLFFCSFGGPILAAAESFTAAVLSDEAAAVS